MYATGFGMIFSEARNAKGIARIAPKIVPKTAMEIVCRRRYGTSVSDVPKRSALSGLKIP